MSPMTEKPTADTEFKPYSPRVIAHYRPEMAPPDAQSYSKSPTKPRRFMEYLASSPVQPFVTPFGSFPPVSPAQLATAHADDYIQSFLSGLPADLGSARPDGSGIRWTEEFAKSVLYTNGSLISATRAALRSPELIHLSPTSGFHHATPTEGAGFCTFSGQVIAALDVWRTQRKRGAWIDLDGHYGNSIDDTYTYAPDLAEAIPPGCNINPAGFGGAYIRSLSRSLLELHKLIITERVSYVCVALGADSHQWDQMGGQLDTGMWIGAVDLVFSFIRDWAKLLKRPVPVVLSLFGGYRDDHPESVLGLHAMGVARALMWLGNAHELDGYLADVRPPADH